MGPPGRTGLMAGKRTRARCERRPVWVNLKSPALPSAAWPPARRDRAERGHCLPTVTLRTCVQATTVVNAIASGGGLAGAALPLTIRKVTLCRTASVFDMLYPSPYQTPIPSGRAPPSKSVTILHMGGMAGCPWGRIACEE